MQPNIYQRMRQILKGNFNDVRDGWASMPLYIDVDLSVARTELNPLILNIAGNSFYVDQLPMGGNATVTFQDTSTARGSAPIYCQQGSVFYVPFTQIEIKNEVQTGKILRIIYGVDLDFAAGTATNVVVSGTVNIKDNGREYGQSYNQTVALVSGVAQNIIPPASNVNGIALVNATIVTQLAGNTMNCSLIAKSTPPTNINDGDVIINNFDAAVFNGSLYIQSGKLITPINIPAGKGVYVIGNSTASGGITGLYTLL